MILGPGVIAQLPAIIWTTDSDLCIRSIAGGAMQSTSIAAGSAIGRPVGDVLCTGAFCDGEGPRECAVSVAHRRALMGDSVGFDLRDFRGSGRDLDVMVEPLLDEDQMIVGCVGLALDVTERRRVRRMEQERRDLADAVADMEQVLAVIGHELRTPLTALRVMAEHLLDACEPDERSEGGRFLHSIHDEVIRLSMMINDLLDAAHVSHDANHWDFTRVSLGELCREAVRSIEPLVERGRVEIVCSVSPRDLTINLNPCAIRRLLANLLSNAQRHTAGGTIELHAVRSDDRFVELTVRDTGSGIPDHIIDKLGVPFALSAGVLGSGRPGHGGDDHAAGHVAETVIGSGLGLAICNRIAAAHGGSLRIDTQPGQGTTVTVRLRADLNERGLAFTPQNVRADSTGAPQHESCMYEGTRNSP